METPATTPAVQSPAAAKGSKAAAAKAPAPAPVAAAPVSANGKAPQVEPESFTDLQQDETAFGSFFGTLTGEAPTEPEAKGKPKAQPSPEPPAPQVSPDPKAAEGDDDDDTDETPLPADAAGDEDESVLSESPEEEADAKAGVDDSDTAKQLSAIKAESFKLREQKRTLKAELAAKETALKELEAKVQTIASAPAGAVLPEITGAYANVTQPDHVPNVVAWLDSTDVELEDFLDSGEESLTHPQLGELTRKEAKVNRRWIAAEKARASEVRNALVTHAQRIADSTAQAQKRYPFVFDAKSRFNTIVLDLVKSEPALNAVPSKSLALGRMAVGKMIEDAPPDVRRQISALLVNRPAAPAPKAPAAESSTPARPRAEARAVQEPALESKPSFKNQSQRLIDGEMNAIADSLASVLGG